MAYAPVQEVSRERVLTRFIDAGGCAREVLARGEDTGRVTVFERPVDGREGPRVVGVLDIDEPQANAVLLAELFAADAAARPLRCRLLDAEREGSRPSAPRATSAPSALRDDHGRTWRLVAVVGTMTVPELRWCDDTNAVVSVRDVVAAMQAYAPVREATEMALGQVGTSTAALRAELERVLESPILLNRCLRERVVGELAAGRLSMGEISARCGRTKRDGSGARSGDTSWLARRVGLLAEAGRGGPTPWVHTEVLALIARTGLGVTPREVETP